MKKIIFYFTSKPKRTMVFAIFWTALILFACFIPGKDVPDVKIFQADKLVHLGLFAVCSFLWGIIIASGGRGRFLLWVFLSNVLFGILIEIVQSTDWVQGRSGDVFDALADAIGAALGIFVVFTLGKRDKVKSA